MDLNGEAMPPHDAGESLSEDDLVAEVVAGYAFIKAMAARFPGLATDAIAASGEIAGSLPSGHPYLPSLHSKGPRPVGASRGRWPDRCGGDSRAGRSVADYSGLCQVLYGGHHTGPQHAEDFEQA